MSDDFQKLVLNYTTGGLVCLAVSLGKKLGLTQALFDLSSPSYHVTPQEVAAKANCNPRYVKEWLSCLACADIIEVDEEEKFYVCDKKKEFLEASSQVVQMSFIPLFSQVMEPLSNAFSNDKPQLGLKYSDYSEFHVIMADWTKHMHQKALVPKLLPDIGHDVLAKLESGIHVLDVGCGDGFHVQLLGRTFPKTTFIGLDICEKAIGMANDHKAKDGTQNTSFIVSNAAEMPAEWTNTFDFVTIFDACHDQMRPDLCMKEIYRVLKPGGVFAMVEIIGTSNVAKDKEKSGQMASILYGISLFHCLPVGSNRPDALCMGTMWGRERGLKLLREGGFEDPQCHSLSYFPTNFLYVAQKKNGWNGH